MGKVKLKAASARLNSLSGIPQVNDHNVVVDNESDPH